MAFLKQPYKSLQTWWQGWVDGDWDNSVQPQPQGRRPSTDSLVHWVLPGKLAIGRLPQPGEALALAQAGVNAILSLCAPQEGTLPADILSQFACSSCILPDSRAAVPLKLSDLTTAVGLVHQQIQQGQVLYLHCIAGIERSPLVCMAYLCRHHHLELWESLHLVRQIRPAAMPTESQLRVLRRFLQNPGSSPEPTSRGTLDG